MQSAWSGLVRRTDPAAILSAKFKDLRHDLKCLSKRLSNLTLLIDKCNKVIFFMDCVEDCRSLTDPENGTSGLWLKNFYSPSIQENLLAEMINC